MQNHFYYNIQGWFNFQDLYTEIVNRLDGGLLIEIGTWKGCSAAYMAVEIINSNKPFIFHCVDTWKGSIEHLDIQNPAYEPLLETPDGLYNHFLQNIEPVKNTIVPVRKTSIEASKDYTNESVDFCFIDASHEYEDVKADLVAWYPKIKTGRIIAGHDADWPGVSRAVNEFTTNLGIKLCFPSGNCWAFKKK